ncbi:MAG: response regulator [Bradyrhizobium sp.]|jgi:DNA-binding response OmpR family regulator
MQSVSSSDHFRQQPCGCWHRDFTGHVGPTPLPIRAHCRATSELGSTLPIIFLTGHPDVPTAVRTIKAGAEDFLLKPVSSALLLQAIERAVVRHEVSRDRKVRLDIVRAHIAELTPREREPYRCRSHGCASIRMSRLSHQAVLGEVAN